ncbi:hypothetical protein BKA57DRAFT_87520 [Linnemannia elongata]|nr:hypothetical protein BKA57DRAFT_87520 [Linnemannia elongata]
MPLTASQSGLGAAQGLYTDDQNYRSIDSSIARPSPHPHPSQSQSQPHQHQHQLPYNEFVPSSTSPSPKQKRMTTTTTKKATIGRQRERTHSNTTSVIDPSALQYASKFSNSNNNVIVTSAMAGLSNVSGPSNSTTVLPQGGLHLQSHHHNNTSTHTSSNTSTTTTFYSGVKLAPPVLSASVEQLERRASDQKVWYTIQVCPCDLTIITPASTSVTTSASSSTGGAVTCIPRRPYKIYRRYEDVADFADQLEEEFTGRMVASSAGIGLQHDIKDYLNAALTASTTSGGGFGSNSYCVNREWSIYE